MSSPEVETFGRRPSDQLAAPLPFPSYMRMRLYIPLTCSELTTQPLCGLGCRLWCGRALSQSHKSS
jgi:hypothetical protein